MRRGFTLVEIMIMVAIIALLLTMIIPGVYKRQLAANVSVAQVTLKNIATAAEKYSKDNNGTYPKDIGVLVNPSSMGSPVYLSENHCDGKVRNGYIFTCDFNPEAKGYNIFARPLNCRTTGDKSFTITTGGLFSIDNNCVSSGG
ncbi:MAG: type II secretion system protein [Candidatus Omnitrophota bacterium]